MEAAAANEEESVGEDEVDEVDEVDEGGSDKDLSTLGEEPPESVKDTSNKIRMSRAQRNKQLRRSLDNSQLLQKKGSGTQFPILSSKSGGGSPTANSKMGEPLLPSLSQSGSSKGSPFAPNPMEKLRMERARHVGKNGKGGKKSHSSRLRRSFDDVASRGGAMATSPSSISIMPVTDIEVGVDGALCPPNEAPPSLLKSYSDNIPRLESPLRLTAFGDVSRSMRMKRMMEAK